MRIYPISYYETTGYGVLTARMPLELRAKGRPEGAATDSCRQLPDSVRDSPRRTRCCPRTCRPPQRSLPADSRLTRHRRSAVVGSWLRRCRRPDGFRSFCGTKLRYGQCRSARRVLQRPAFARLIEWIPFGSVASPGVRVPTDARRIRAQTDSRALPRTGQILVRSVSRPSADALRRSRRSWRPQSGYPSGDA